ncbi:MAG TPA: GNAT family protein [Bacteriovoracaceae bacterium]|nr:GNAT family protein [Bacteriovoracaceae bacterium]
MSNIKYLFNFSSPSFDLVEVKRLNLKDAPLSEIYRWLLIRKESGKVWQLDFKSIKQDSRAFIEGELKFNDKQAQLCIFNETINLKVMKNDEVSADVDKMVSKYIGQTFEKHNLFYFRELKPSDIQHFNQWAFDKEAIKYSMTKFHQMSSLDHVRDWYSSTLDDSKCFQLGIVDPKSDQLIGYAGIAGINKVDGNGEYFIFIGNKDYWGKGIALAVTKKIIEYGFQKMDLHRIFLTASSKNPGAIKAYVKSGFKHEGIMREAFYRGDEYSDKVIMGILHDEFIYGTVQ